MCQTACCIFIHVKLFHLWHYDNENDTMTMVLWTGYYLLKWRILMLKKTKTNSLAQSYIGDITVDFPVTKLNASTISVLFPNIWSLISTFKILCSWASCINWKFVMIIWISKLLLSSSSENVCYRNYNACRCSINIKLHSPCRDVVPCVLAN